MSHAECIIYTYITRCYQWTDWLIDWSGSIIIWWMWQNQDRWAETQTLKYVLSYLFTSGPGCIWFCGLDLAHLQQQTVRSRFHIWKNLSYTENILLAVSQNQRITAGCCPDGGRGIWARLGPTTLTYVGQEVSFSVWVKTRKHKELCDQMVLKILRVYVKIYQFLEDKKQADTL